MERKLFPRERVADWIEKLIERDSNMFGVGIDVGDSRMARRDGIDDFPHEVRVTVRQRAQERAGECLQRRHFGGEPDHLQTEIVVTHG